MLQPGTFGLTLLLAMLTALGPLSMDMYLPSLPDIAHVLGAPVARTQLTISSYLIGFAVGQMIYGPLSDRYGRRPVLLAAVALYLASTLACAAAQSVDLLIAARLLQGISGSGAIVWHAPSCATFIPGCRPRASSRSWDRSARPRRSSRR
jgi:MFS transporter, DHA1 family, multidrug resistance protein